MSPKNSEMRIMNEKKEKGKEVKNSGVHALHLHQRWATEVQNRIN